MKPEVYGAAPPKRDVKMIFWAAASLTVAVALLWSLSPDGEVASRADFEYSFRINSEPHINGDEDLDRALDIARGAGADAINIPVAWYGLDRGDCCGEPRTYDWTYLDHAVGEVEERNMKVNFQIESTPTWVHPYMEAQVAERDDRKWYPPRGEAELARFSNFMGDLARRYEGRVDHYEVWNEPNLGFYWRSPGQDFDSPAYEPDPAEYAAMLRAAHAGLTEADPDARILFGGLSRNDLPYLRGFYEAASKYPEAAENDFFFDILGVHPYSSPRFPGDVDRSLLEGCDPETPATAEEAYRSFAGFECMKEEMDGWEDADKDLYFSEYGIPTVDEWGQGSISDERRALYLKRAFELARERPYVEGMTWHLFNENNVSPAGWHIVDDEFDPSLTFRAFEQATGAEPRNAEVGLDLPDAVSGTVPVRPNFRGFSEGEVSRLELYVDGELAAERASPSLLWDTLDEAEGVRDVMVAAYTTGGDVWHSGPAATEVDNGALDAGEPAARVEGYVLFGSVAVVGVEWGGGSGGADRYELRYSADGGPYKRAILLAPKKPSAIMLLEAGRSYSFQVRAFGDAGAWSGRAGLAT